MADSAVVTMDSNRIETLVDGSSAALFYNTTSPSGILVIGVATFYHLYSDNLAISKEATCAPVFMALKLLLLTLICLLYCHSIWEELAHKILPWIFQLQTMLGLTAT
jgi:hypothetical protein